MEQDPLLKYENFRKKVAHWEKRPKGDTLWSYSLCETKKILVQPEKSEQKLVTVTVCLFF